MNTAPKLESLTQGSPNRLIELAGQLDDRPSSLMTKSERLDERRKMLSSYRAYLDDIPLEVFATERLDETILTHIRKLIRRRLKSIAQTQTLSDFIE